MIVNQSAKLEAIKLSPLLRNLPTEALQELLVSCQERQYHKRALVYRPSEEESQVFLVLSGEVVIYQLVQGRKIILEVLKTGDIFGDLRFAHNGQDLIDGNYVRVNEEGTSLCRLSADRFVKLVERYPKFALALLAHLRDRLHTVASKVRDTALASAEVRLLNELLRLTLIYGQDDADLIEINKRLTHQTLAELTGLTRETVTKTLLKLIRAGFLEMGPKRLIRLNKQKIRDECLHCLKMRLRNK